MFAGDGTFPPSKDAEHEEKSLMHKLESLKRRSLQSFVAKLGLAEESQDQGGARTPNNNETLNP